MITMLTVEKYTGHLLIHTHDRVRITQKRFVDIGDNTTIELDGDIESVEISEDDRGWVDITKEVLM